VYFIHRLWVHRLGAEMAVTYNLKGTTNSSFKIGKNGVVLAPADNTSSTTVTFPNATGTLVLQDSTDTLSNKSFSGNIAFDTNTLFVDADNNRVGIGTTAPSFALDVTASSLPVAFKNTGTGGTYQAALSVRSTSPSYGAAIQFEDGTNDGYIAWYGQELIFAGTGGTERMRIDSSGNLGIGTTSPSVELDVAGDGAFSGNVTVTGNLTVNGTTTTVNSTEVNIQNAFVFEGATADEFETTLTVTDPTADRTVTIPDATTTLVGTNTTDTLSNKTISLTNNTLTGTTAEFNSALSDDSFATLTGTETLTNKTLTTPDVNTSLKMVSGAQLQFRDNQSYIAENGGILLWNSASGRGVRMYSDGAERVAVSYDGNLELKTGVDIVFEGATSNDFETTLTVTDPTADRTVTLPDATTTLVGTDTTDTLTNKTMTAPVLNAPVFGTGTNSPYFTEVRFNNSNIMKFNQMYTGASSGSYFSANEYQKVVTITPDGDAQNYQVIGRITAQNAAETHTVYFNAALRSNTLPDLSWTIDYSEEYNGSRYIDPQLWTKETATAGFIFAFKTLGTIYGTVTVDFDVIPRNSSQLDNVSVNSTQNSEQTSVDTGFTERDMTRVFRRQGAVHTLSGNLLPDTTETYDIGSSTLRFNDIYLAGSTVDIGGTKLSKDSNGDLDIKDASDVRKTIKAAAIELFDTDGKKIKIERDATSGKMKTRKYGSDGSEEASQDVIDISEDKSPKLGGDLDANGNDIDMGTNTITDTKVGQWDTAYGWGNHASAGYVSGDIGFPTDLGAITGSATDHLGLGPDLGSIASGDTFVGLIKDFGLMGSTVTTTSTQTLTNKTLTSPTLTTPTFSGAVSGSVAIANTTTDDSLLITTTEDSSSAAPVITLKRNSSSVADADYLGQLKFKGENDADQEVVYAKITGKIQDASDGTEDGIIEFANKKAGSNVITARLRSDSLQLLNSTGLTVAGDTTLSGTLNGHTIPSGAGTLALTSSFTHFHSSAQTVTSAEATTNASGTVDYTFSELSGAIHYVAFLNRTLMRASEYSVSGTTLTVNSGVLATDDQIEVTGISV
jgi:hypothetical protein